MQIPTNRDNVGNLDVLPTPPQQQQYTHILSHNFCDVTSLQAQLEAAQAEIVRLKRDNYRLTKSSQRWQERAERATARAERQSLFLDLIDAVCAVPTKFLDGSEKVIVRTIARAVMFDSRARRSGDFTLVDLPRLIRDVGGFSRTPGDIARLVDMGLFLQQPSGDGALWLAIPDDILDRLAHLDSAFARHYGSPVRCPRCGHAGPPKIRDTKRRDVMCSCCDYVLSSSFDVSTFSFATGERASEPLSQQQAVDRVSAPLPDQPRVVDAEPVITAEPEPVPTRALIPAEPVSLPAAPAPADDPAPEQLPALEPISEPEPESPAPVILYHDRPITVDGLDVLLSMGRVMAFPLSTCPHCLGRSFNWTGRAWECARCLNG